MAKLKEITVSQGVSVEINGVWYKPNATVTIEMNVNDGADTRDAVFTQAWDLVNKEIERQINAIEQG